MKMKILFIVGLAVVGVTVAIVVSLDLLNSSVIVADTDSTSPAKAQITPQTLPPENAVAHDAPRITNTAKSNIPANVTPKSTNQARRTQDNQLMINGYVVQDPLARAALGYVGTDSGANAYWTDAINDPDLPSEERKDLIEDLNEDGFPDPKHPGPQDVPMILARIQLIETLAPYAMDQVNANAFDEAEKDLFGMLNGQPP